MAGREDKGKISSKRDRYWSVMLVGDHGRVIPFRHFKGIALTFCAAFLLILAAFIVVAFLYAGQINTVAALESQIADVKRQNSKLRDEKDLYLTKLTLQENTKPEKPQAVVSPAPSKAKADNPTAPVEAASKPSQVTPAAKERSSKKPAVTQKQAPKVNPMAEIRKFSVNYDAKREILRAQFRIYNRSKPKKPLSGKSAVVFKHLGQPSIQWMPVPALPLNGGKPAGDKGQAFQIRNYLTMKFRAYRQKPPIQYNSVTAYVFSNDGRLLTSKDFAVNIDVPPPVKKDRVKASAQPAEAAAPKEPQQPSPEPAAPPSPQPIDGGQPPGPSDVREPASPGGLDPKAVELPSQDNRTTDAAQEVAPGSEGRPSGTPTGPPTVKEPKPQAPAAPSDQRSGSSSPENGPGDNVQSSPSTTTESTEAAPKPTIEGDTR